MVGAFHCVFQIQLARRGFTNVEKIGPKVIRQLLDEINKLERNVEKDVDSPTHEFNQTKIKNICTNVIDGAGDVDAKRWLQLSIEKQRECVDHLTGIRNQLLDISKMSNPRELKEFLENAGESNQSMIWLVIFSVIFVATLLSLVR